MGRTAFSGPVYGAKSVLLTGLLSAMSSGTGDPISTVMLKTIVPSYEDWYLTEFTAHRQSTGSTSLRMTLDDDSTELSSIALNSSLAEQNVLNTITPTGGEFEGVQVLGGSTLSVLIKTGSSGVPASSGITATVRGFIRYLDTTRAF